MKKAIEITAVSLAVLIVGVLAMYVFVGYPKYIEPKNAYDIAEELIGTGDYVRAAMQFSSIRGYRDSADKAKQAWMQAGEKALGESDYDLAYSCFVNAGAGAERFSEIDEAFFKLGSEKYLNSYKTAELFFDRIKAKDKYSADMDECRLKCAKELLGRKQFEEAKDVFALCSENVLDRIGELWFEEGKRYLDGSEIDTAYTCFNNARSNVSDAGTSELLDKINKEWENAARAASASGNTALAARCYSLSNNFVEAKVIEQRNKTRCEEARAAFNEGDYETALTLLNTITPGYGDSAAMLEVIAEKLRNSAAAGGSDFYAILGINGNVTLLGDAWGISSPNWVNIDSIAIGTEEFILGVRSNGTVAAAGKSSYNRTDVGDWTNIKQAACGQYHSVGLTSGGRVLSCGWNYYGQGMTETWSSVIFVACGDNTTYGVTASGRVLACGDNSKNQLAVGSWNDVVAVSAGSGHVVGLKSDGTVVACGDNSNGQCEVDSWTDIVAVSAGANHTVGLKSDGTLVACGRNASGECSVSMYSKVASVSAGRDITVIVFEDGSYVALGAVEASNE